MAERKVGVRELKTHLSGYLREIKKGATIVITERGNEVGRIIPALGSTDDRMQSLIRSGFADWNGKKLKPGKPVAKLKAGAKTLAEIVSEDRD
jgi:prevent-host-death family protein